MMFERLRIRPALESDAAAIRDVVRSSIEQLCFPDHKGDAAVLELWLANKTVANVERWIENPDNSLVVAAEDSAILAAGCVTAGGEVVLNYVAPPARLRGISSAILKHMEMVTMQAGKDRCTLDSTVTAHEFYRGRGYTDVDVGREKFGMWTFPMVKLL